MLAFGKRIVRCKTHLTHKAFTLVELLFAIVLMAMVISGLMYGYVQANRFAEWSSMSLAAQSYALQGLEQVRAADWFMNANPVRDVLPVPTSGPTNIWETDYMDVPVSGSPFSVTNHITLSTISTTPSVRMIRSDCIWVFPLTKQTFTNTVVTYRAPDQS